ncbi:CYTH domain-containing protein [Candidatus Kaiserbacteria bacterium]|nr:CYTH domain-containing protein [Candidatus Kaiserbacteria bacterium]
MQSYEVEIKSLLGGPERAEEVRQAMKDLDPSTTPLSINRQLNHYFEGGSLGELCEKIVPKLSKEAAERLSDIAGETAELSVRTRDKDGAIFLVVKATLRDDSSSNGVARMEFEERVPLTLAELDDLVMSAGFRYQAKWSRQREEYICHGINVTLDKNAGYGWLAEFERVVNDPAKVDDAEREIRALMQELGASELPQERLERMFSHYNAHWQDYYGTDKIFTIE